MGLKMKVDEVVSPNNKVQSSGQEIDVHRLAKEMTNSDQSKRIVTPKGSEWRKQMDSS